MEMTTSTPVTYDNVLAHVAANVAAATDSNFRSIAAGTLAYLVGFTWAPKDERKPAADIKADILRAFREDGDKGKSKRYEFAGLCLTIARALGKGHAWGDELRQQESVEAGVIFLAARFGSVAASVAALAKAFGTERSGGNRKEKAFADALAALIDKAQEAGEQIAVGPAIFALLQVGAPSADDATALVGRLLSTADDATVAAFIATANDVLAARHAKAEAVQEAERLAA